MGSDSEPHENVVEGRVGGNVRVPDLATLLDIDALSALAIENATFETSDIAARRVSYVMLCEAGVDPAAADRLRRRYSLVWTFVWTEGAHLLQRAEQLQTLRDSERSWIAASVSGDTRRRHRRRRRWNAIRRAADEPSPSSSPPFLSQQGTRPSASRCPRCREELTTYSLGSDDAVTCGQCGYVRLATDHRTNPSNDPSWDEALREFVDNH